MNDQTREWPDLAGRLTPEGHILPVRVYYEDTDFSGLVYHANYLQFMERGRSDYLRLIGVHHADLDQGTLGERLVFAVRRMEIDFLKPARIDDIVEVHTRTEKIGGARLFLGQLVRHRGIDLIAASVTVAILGSDGRPRRIPAEIAEKFTI